MIAEPYRKFIIFRMDRNGPGAFGGGADPVHYIQLPVVDYGNYPVSGTDQNIVAMRSQVKNGRAGKLQRTFFFFCIQINDVDAAEIMADQQNIFLFKKMQGVYGSAHISHQLAVFRIFEVPHCYQPVA